MLFPKELFIIMISNKCSSNALLLLCGNAFYFYSIAAFYDAQFLFESHSS